MSRILIGALSLMALVGCISVQTVVVATQVVNVPIGGGAVTIPAPTLPPVAQPGGLTGAGICAAIRPEAVGQVLGMTGGASKVLADDPTFGSGCQYVFGADAAGTVVYANLFAAPEAAFEHIRSISGSPTAVAGVGDEAFTAQRPDGPQLWALVRGRGAVGVAIGGAWSLDRATLLAQDVIALLK